MEKIKALFNIIAEQFKSLHCIIDIIDILLVAIIIFYIVKFIRDRRASKLAMGVFLIVILMFINDTPPNFSSTERSSGWKRIIIAISPT